MIDLSISLYDLEYFLLIFTRVTCFILIAPFFGMNNTPRRVRVALSFFTAALLYQVLSPADMLISEDVFEMALVIMKEAICGLLLGFGANVCLSIVGFAGSIADMETGLSMSTLLDPATNETSSITGVMYQYIFMMLLIATGMYRYLFGALADSFKLIPIGKAHFHTDMLLDTVVKFLGDYILIGFRIVLPIFVCILLLNAILGVMAKVSPQMNMFAVGIQLKIIVGLSILFFTASMLPSAADMVFNKMREIIAAFANSMI